MENLADPLLLSVLNRCPLEDRLLCTELVDFRWHNLTVLSLMERFGSEMRTDIFERMSVVCARLRNEADGAGLLQSADFLHRLFCHVLTLIKSEEIDVVRFSPGRETLTFPEWFVDENVMDVLHQLCPNLRRLDFRQAELLKEAAAKLLDFQRLQHLDIKRVDADFLPVLQQLRLETLTISGKSAPLQAVSGEHLRTLCIQSPVPTCTTQLLATLSSSLPNLRSFTRTGGEREAIPEPVLAEICAHPCLDSYSDAGHFLPDELALRRLADGNGGEGFRSLRVYAEDGLRLGCLELSCKRLRTLVIDAKNLDPDELGAVFGVSTLRKLSLSWTFRDDPGREFGSYKPVEIKCLQLRSLRLHLDFLSANGLLWSKAVLRRTLCVCGRLRDVRNTDWLSADGLREISDDCPALSRLQREIDVNIDDEDQLLGMLQPVERLSTCGSRWPSLTTLRLFVEGGPSFLFDLSCLNGNSLPNLRTLKVHADDDVFFVRFCALESLPRLRQIDGAVRFEEPDAETAWLERLARHPGLFSVATVQTSLNAARFGEIFSTVRAAMAAEGYRTTALVVAVSTSKGRRFRITEVERRQWLETAETLLQWRVVLKLSN